MRRIETIAEGAVTRQVLGRLSVTTGGQGFTEITPDVTGFVQDSGISHGLLILFCRHTSASLTIQENADPDVRIDLLTALDRLAPRHGAALPDPELPDRAQGRMFYLHRDEGPDDMPGHIRTMLTDTGLTVPVVDRRLGLGTWQGIYLIEHRDQQHRREVLLHLSGA
ncbi:secondary thiamine-phosphate synthase enzyme YjbQ [Methylobacterium sp. JK268]